MRQVENGSWVSDKQKVRHALREAPWCLEDDSRARLPVLKGAGADEVYLELVGAPLLMLPPNFLRTSALAWSASPLMRLPNATPQ